MSTMSNRQLTDPLSPAQVQNNLAPMLPPILTNGAGAPGGSVDPQRRLPQDSETEDAASALEEIALGRKQYGGYGGLNLETPMSKGQPTTNDIPSGSWTSILLAPQPPPFSEQRATREKDNASLLSKLPGNESVSEALVEVFMSE